MNRVYRLVCRVLGHDVFELALPDAAGVQVPLVRGCARCDWSEPLPALKGEGES